MVLGYIRNTTSRFKVFVANRVQTIHNCSRVQQWFHLPSQDNPADDGSRAKQSSRWLDGPDFLYSEPLPVNISADVPDSLPEKCLSTDAVPVFYVNPFRSWHSTKKVWAWILRFIHNCRVNDKKERVLSTCRN